MKVPIQSQRLLSLFIVFTLSCVQAMEITRASTEDDSILTSTTRAKGHVHTSSLPHPSFSSRGVLMRATTYSGEETPKLFSEQLPSQVSKTRSLRDILSWSRTERNRAQGSVSNLAQENIWKRTWKVLHKYLKGFTPRNKMGLTKTISTRTVPRAQDVKNENLPLGSERGPSRVVLTIQEASENRKVWFKKLHEGEKAGQPHWVQKGTIQPATNWAKWRAEDDFLTIENLARTLVNFGENGPDTIRSIVYEAITKATQQVDAEVERDLLQRTEAEELKVKLKKWNIYLTFQPVDFQFFLYTMMLTRFETKVSQHLFDDIVLLLRGVLGQSELPNNPEVDKSDLNIITFLKEQISKGVEDVCRHSVGTKYPVTFLSPLLYKTKGLSFQEHYQNIFPEDEKKARKLTRAALCYQGQMARFSALKGMNSLHWEIMSKNFELLDNKKPRRLNRAFELLSQSLELELKAQEENLMKPPLDDIALANGILGILDGTVTTETQRRFIELYETYRQSFYFGEKIPSVTSENIRKIYPNLDLERD